LIKHFQFITTRLY